MGTNFYFHTTAGEELHIAKRSGAGGSHCAFSFQSTMGPDGPLDSWSRWKHTILSGAGKVVDEYGVEQDPQAFVVEVEDTLPEHRRSQYDWVQTHQDLSYLEKDYWLCPDGFSFTEREFF